MTQLLDLGKLRFNYLGDWVNSTTYEANDVVRYGGNAYCYTYGLKTSGNLPTNATYWAVILEGFNFRSDYNNATAYKVGDAVVHGGKVYYCIADTTGNIPPNVTYWTQFADGVSPKGTYNNATAYAPNDIVQYGGGLYRAIANTTGNVPTNTTYWTLYQGGIKPLGNWATTTAYYPDDVVTYGGSTYRCLVAHASGAFATDLAALKWQKYAGGFRWRGAWATGTSYVVDDIVYDSVSSYLCVADHTASAAFVTDFTASKWVLFAEGGDYVLPTTSSNVGKYLSTDGTNYVWANGERNWSEKTSAYTAVTGDRLLLNSAAGAFTVTLPAAPSVGDFIQLTDAAGAFATNNVTLARNGLKILGVNEDLILDKNNIGFKLVYSGATYGWRLS